MPLRSIIQLIKIAPYCVLPISNLPLEVVNQSIPPKILFLWPCHLEVEGHYLGAIGTLPTRRASASEGDCLVTLSRQDCAQSRINSEKDILVQN